MLRSIHFYKMMSDKQNLFKKLHADYHAMVLQMCLGFMKGDLDSAKDLAQNIYINVWNTLDRFKGHSTHKTWIYRITVNTCLKYIRDTEQQKSVAIEQVADVLHAESEHQNYQSLYKAIGQLAEVDRLIMMLVLDELKYKEIANIIGISEGNLRVKIHRIKTTLKKILNDE